MNFRINPKEQELFEEFRAGGIPVHEGLLSQVYSVFDELDITSIGDVRDAIFDPLAGGVVYLLRVSIKNRSNRIFHLKAIRLEAPMDLGIRMLHAPFGAFLEECAKVYPFFKDELRSADIFQDHLGRRGTLYPGDLVEGILLGWGETPVPRQYGNHQFVPVRLAAYEHSDNCYYFPIKLLMRRLQEKMPVYVKRTGSLFSKRDNVDAPALSPSRNAVETSNRQVAEEELLPGMSQASGSSEQGCNTVGSLATSTIDSEKGTQSATHKRSALKHSRATKRTDLRAA